MGPISSPIQISSASSAATWAAGLGRGMRSTDSGPRAGRYIFVVFDDGLSADLPNFFADRKGKSFILFPLCSNFRLVETVRRFFLDGGAHEVQVLDSASLIDAEVGVIRDTICAWIHAASDAQVAGRSLKNWFLLPPYRLSTWWLGLLAENNSLKSHFHLRLAQLRAVERSIEESSVGDVFVSLGDGALSEGVSNLASEAGIRVFSFPSWSQYSRRERFLRAIRRIRGGEMFLGFAAWVRLCAQAVYVRWILGRSVISSGSLLIATYFPAFDPVVEKSGVFRNRYTGDLQSLLERMHIPVSWILMYASLNGVGFRQAVAIARRFRINGVEMFFPEQFLSPGGLFRILFVWLKQALLARRLEREALDCLSKVAPMGRAARPLLVQRWRSSFLGPQALLGVSYMEQFRRMWAAAPEVRTLAYICEMQTWEKALVGTRRGLADRVQAIAMQHTVVSRDYYHYFAVPHLARDFLNDSSMPQPEVIAVNGPAVASLLSPCGYRRIAEVEALRFGYLTAKKTKEQSEPSALPPFLLVIGPNDRDEARAILRLVYEAFPQGAGGAIMLKSHPATPLSRLCKELGIEPEACGYRVGEGGVGALLWQASAVLVGSSAVAIEAAMMGKPVFIPKFADALVMSPVSGLGGYQARQVCSPRELRTFWEDVLAHPAPVSFPPPYWHLEPALARWEQLFRECGFGE